MNWAVALQVWNFSSAKGAVLKGEMLAHSHLEKWYD